MLIDLDRQRNTTLPLCTMQRTEDTPDDVFCSSEENKNTVGELFIDPHYDPLNAIHQAATQFGQNVIKNMYLMPANREKLDEGQYKTGTAFQDRLTRLHDQLTKIDDYFDYVIIDCSPSGNSIINDNAVYAADTLIIPVDSSIYAAVGIHDTLDRFSQVRNEDVKDNVLLLRSKVDTRNKRTNKAAEELSGFADSYFIKASVRLSTNIEQAAQFGVTIFEYDKSHAICKDIKQMTKEIMGFHNG